MDRIGKVKMECETREELLARALFRIEGILERTPDEIEAVKKIWELVNERGLIGEVLEALRPVMERDDAKWFRRQNSRG